jgi:hypothetical protein
MRHTSDRRRHHRIRATLGSRAGTINTALKIISEQGQVHSEAGAAIKELGEAVMYSSAIQDSQKQETLRVIANIASGLLHS